MDPIELAKERCATIFRVLGAGEPEWTIMSGGGYYAGAEYTAQDWIEAEDITTDLQARIYTSLPFRGTTYPVWWMVYADLPPHPRDPEASGGSLLLGSGPIDPFAQPEGSGASLGLVEASRGIVE